MSQRWIRSQRAAVADAGDDLLLVAADASVRRLDGDSAELGRTVIAFVSHARSEAEIVAHIESLAGPLGERRPVITDLLRLLADTGAISRVPVSGASGGADAASATTAGAQPGHARAPGANIVLGVSGAIAATHAPALVSALQRRGHTVEVALTQTAQRFVSIDALGAIAGREIHTTIWPHTPHAPAPHVALAQWADLVIVYPASGTTIHRIANGDFSDLVAAVALTTRAPVVVAPSMNIAMLESPAVQRNLDLLRDNGVIVLHGIPSQEVADAPATRSIVTGAAAAPGEVAATVDALRTSGALHRREPQTSTTASTWDAVYRAAAAGATRTDGLPLVPWVSSTCDDDIAARLAAELTYARHNAPGGPARLLDVGCGLGQIAQHAAALGFRVVATDISEVALRTARDHTARELDITWVRDDICASNLISEHDVIVDRATLHTLPRARVHAWAASMRRLLAPTGTLIVKTHRDGVSGVTHGWTATALSELMARYGFELATEHAATLPGVTSPEPVPSLLIVLRRT